MSKEAARFAAILKGWGPALTRAVAKTSRSRWPAGSPGGKGGQFAPGKALSDGLSLASGHKGSSYDPAAEQALGEAALKRVLAAKSDVHDAMTLRSGRKVTFLWGTKGGGIAHVVGKHGPVVEDIPKILAHGVESEPYHPHPSNTTVNMRVKVTLDTATVVLSLGKDQANKPEWVLTAFDPEKERPGADGGGYGSPSKLRKGALTDFATFGSGTTNIIDLPLSLLKFRDLPPSASVRPMSLLGGLAHATLKGSAIGD